jgi:hypothetical protein
MVEKNQTCDRCAALSRNIFAQRISMAKKATTGHYRPVRDEFDDEWFVAYPDEGRRFINLQCINYVAKCPNKDDAQKICDLLNKDREAQQHGETRSKIA